MTATLLPSEFSDLERFATKWCLDSERERYAMRLSSSMAEMQDFYDAFMPRAEAAIAHCEQFPLDDLPLEVDRLLHLLYSLVMVSFPVEAWHQPKIPDTGAAYLDLVLEPAP